MGQNTPNLRFHKHPSFLPWADGLHGERGPGTDLCLFVFVAPECHSAWDIGSAPSMFTNTQTFIPLALI